MLIERFLQYIDFKGLSLSKVEKDLGLSNGYLGKQRDRNGSIGSSVVEKIVYAYSDINIEWLICGSGEMLRGNSNLLGGVSESNPSSYGRCNNCTEKDRTILAMEKAIIGYEKLIKVLEAKVDKLERDNCPNSTISKTA